MRPRFRTFLLLLLLMAPGIHAQPGPKFIPCLDTMAINAKFVFVGKIVAIHELVRAGANTNVDVSVEQWLKGDAQSRVTQARIDAPLLLLTNWKAQASRLLIFNGTGIEASERAIDLSDPQVKVLTADMRVLGVADDIVTAAHGAIQRHPGVYRISTFNRYIPVTTVRLLGETDFPVTEVPADADLERWALATLASAQPGERAEAAEALGRFPSEDNVARLRQLLEAPSLPANGPGGTGIDPVRMRAYESLLRMGMSVSKPVGY